jgi:DNA repair ATPase RecN
VSRPPLLTAAERAARRRAWVEELNALFANLVSADNRIASAETLLERAKGLRDETVEDHDEELSQLKRQYDAAVPVVFSEKSTPDARLEAIDNINQILSAIEEEKAAHARSMEESDRAINKAKSERGTALQQRDDWKQKVAVITQKLAEDIVIAP